MPLNEAHLTGARSELFAAAWFMSDGYQVYWPQAQQGPVDFIVEKRGKFGRVQVKTATWNRAAGPWHYLQCRMASSATRDINPKAGLYDLVVIVFENELWCIPVGEIFSTNLSLRSNNPTPKEYGWDRYKKL